jgi:hypothetical protein
VAVVPGFFSLTYVENQGAAWGMLAGRHLFLIGFSLLTLAFLFWRRRQLFDPLWGGRLTLTLLMAGILGNLIDRTGSTYVVDFLDFFWPPPFPAFNVADLRDLLRRLSLHPHPVDPRQKAWYTLLTLPPPPVIAGATATGKAPLPTTRRAERRAILSPTPCSFTAAWISGRRSPRPPNAAASPISASTWSRPPSPSAPDSGSPTRAAPCCRQPPTSSSPAAPASTSKR